MTCSRCGSYHPNPYCYVCAEGEDQIRRRQEREELYADWCRDEMLDRRLENEDKPYAEPLERK